jgi:hypothetical protein
MRYRLSNLTKVTTTLTFCISAVSLCIFGTAIVSCSQPKLQNVFSLVPHHRQEDESQHCFVATKLAVKHAMSVSCALKIEKCATSDDGSESKTHEDVVWDVTSYFHMAGF